MLMSHLYNFLVALWRYLIQLMFISSLSITEENPGTSPLSSHYREEFFPSVFPIKEKLKKEFSKSGYFFKLWFWSLHLLKRLLITDAGHAARGNTANFSRRS